MSLCAVSLSGQLIVGGPGSLGSCGSCGDGSMRTQGLAFACQSLFFQSIKATECPQQIQTAGAVGAAFVELPVEVAEYHLLSVKSNAPIVLRIGAAPATLTGSGGSFPADVDTEELELAVDGVSFTTTFVGDGLTAANVAAQINQAAVGAGFTFLPASVGSGGQLVIAGEKTGSDGAVDVTNGIAAIGLADDAAADGAGEDVPVNGLFLAQFNTAAAPKRVQISGIALVEVLCAGNPA